LSYQSAPNPIKAVLELEPELLLELLPPGAAALPLPFDPRTGRLELVTLLIGIVALLILMMLLLLVLLLLLVKFKVIFAA
jgi:hypothetical protein